MTAATQLGCDGAANEARRARDCDRHRSFVRARGREDRGYCLSAIFEYPLELVLNDESVRQLPQASERQFVRDLIGNARPTIDRLELVAMPPIAVWPCGLHVLERPRRIVGADLAAPRHRQPE